MNLTNQELGSPSQNKNSTFASHSSKSSSQNTSFSLYSIKMPKPINLTSSEAQASPNSVTQQKTIRSPPIDFVVDPTKKIKHTEQTCTQEGLRVSEVPFKEQASKEEDAKDTQQIIERINDVRNVSINVQDVPKIVEKIAVEEKQKQSLRAKDDFNKGPPLNFKANARDLDMPPLQDPLQTSFLNTNSVSPSFENINFINQYVNYMNQQQQLISYIRHQQLIQQLGYSSFGNLLQQQPQQPYENFVQRQLDVQSQQRNRLDQMSKNMQNILKPEKAKNSSTPQSNIGTLKTSNFKAANEGLKLSAKLLPNTQIYPAQIENEMEQNEGFVSTEEPLTERKSESSLSDNLKKKNMLKKKKEVKRNKAPKDKKDKKKIPLKEIIQENQINSKEEEEQKIGKKSAEPRRKNKWQMMAEEKLQESQNESVSKENATNLQSNYVEIEPDYEYLQSIMITNDPAKIGTDNPNQNFVVFTRDTASSSSEIRKKETSVGSRYQASVAKFDGNAGLNMSGKRKCPELVWNPDAVDRNELEEYLNELCKLLKCNKMNQERSLKLLKKKGYKRDKVLVNITKNEKFYSTFLVVPDFGNNSEREQNILQ